MYYKPRYLGGRLIPKKIKKRVNIDKSKSPFSFLKKKNQVNKNSNFNIKELEESYIKSQELYEENQPTPNENRLLMMIYLDDVDSDYVKTSMNISDKQLEILVNNLIDRGYLRQLDTNEIELTREGIYYITTKELELIKV